MIATLDHYAITDYVLHAYVVMPDHLHVLITPSVSVGKSIGLIKGGFSFRAKRELDWKGEIWQPGFTDHRIRDEADWEHHIEYIRLNPVRAKMAEDSVLYPYMNFPNARFPRGLKPQFSGEVDVRAEARTLQTEALQTEALQTETSTLQTEALQTETSTLQTEARTRQPGVRIEPLDSVKGTGFSPSVEASQSRGALAPEGGRR